jgi:hypothetical protein
MMTGFDGEVIGAVLAGGVAVGAGIGRALAALWPATHRPSTKPPPPPTCAPAVVEQVDELHGLLARRDDLGASVVLSHLAELPRIRSLLERIAERLPHPTAE